MVDAVANQLHRLHRRLRTIDDGAVADYIPELTRADPDALGICVASVDGAIYRAGDTQTPFTIQSISKPLSYGLALELHGPDRVHRHVGVEPTGESFNAIDLHPETGAPYNPMVNAGAISISGLIEASHGPGAVDRVLAAYGAFAGRPLAIDEAVYRSEAATGHRNRAIAHLLRGADMLDGDPERALDLYFRQCSVLVDCGDLAMMAATLANGGVHPRTGVVAAGRDTVGGVLAVMATCGMYDGAGRWFHSVGLPAKSGVAGGVIAVLPGRMGIAVYSPRLDEHGNSVRGVRACRELSEQHKLHLTRPDRGAAQAVRTVHRLGEVTSRRVRPAAQAAALVEHAHAVAAIGLQGEVVFSTAEPALATIVAAAKGCEQVVIDLARVSRVAASVAPLLADVGLGLAERGVEAILVGLDGHDRLLALLESGTDGVPPWRPRTFRDLDAALEWCEDRLLDRVGLDGPPRRCGAEEHPLLLALPEPARDRLAARLPRRRHRRGEVVRSPSHRHDEVLLVLTGELSVMLCRGEERRRVATVSPGMVLGALSLFGDGPGTELAQADTDVDCAVLNRALLDELHHSDPASQAILLEGLLRQTAARARQLRREVDHLLA